MANSKKYYFYNNGSLAHVSDEEPQICIATMDTPCSGCMVCEQEVF